MNEFSFIQFSEIQNNCEISLPIKQMSDIAFYTTIDLHSIWAFNKDRTDSTNIGGDIIIIDPITGLKYVKLIGDIPYVNECFTINLINEDGTIVFISNPFFYSTDTEFSLCEYYCYETQFGFEYGTSGATYPNKIRLPLRLHAVQYPQEEKVYVDGNGVRHTLFAKIDKEFELETEYLPDDIHEKIVVMLAHDIVKIETIQVAKSAGYEIDHENEDELTCGTKIHKAKAKMIRNTTLKNTNC